MKFFYALCCFLLLPSITFSSGYLCIGRQFQQVHSQDVLMTKVDPNEKNITFVLSANVVENQGQLIIVDQNGKEIINEEVEILKDQAFKVVSFDALEQGAYQVLLKANNTTFNTTFKF